MLNLLLFVSVIFLVFYFLVKWRYSYWKRRGVMQIPPEFPFGNIKNTVFKRSTLEACFNVLYNELKKNKQKHGGTYILFHPVWIPTDLGLIQRIFTKDFQHFGGHSLVYHHDSELFTEHIFSASGEQWKKLRSSMTPSFTPGKMKGVFDIVVSIGQNLEKKVEKSVDDKQPLLIRDVTACFNTDVIANSAFGLEINTIDNPNNQFRIYGRNLFCRRPIKALVELLFPWNLLGRLGYKFYDQGTSEYFMDVITDAIRFREKNSCSRNDFLQLLLEQQKSEGGSVDEGDKLLTKEEVIVGVFSYYLGGFETSAATTAMLMYELSKRQDIQDKLRNEFNAVLAKYGGIVTYDGIQEMKYADQCIDEALRMYPPLSTVPRMCTKTYRVPDSDVVIDEGTAVAIPAICIQNDPDIYPNPEQFNPENFSKENKANRPSSAWIPFGGGPRQCVGLRFAYVQMKVALIALLKNHRYTLNRKTPTKLTLNPDSITLTSKEELYLDVSKVC